MPGGAGKPQSSSPANTGSSQSNCACQFFRSRSWYPPNGLNPAADAGPGTAAPAVPPYEQLLVIDKRTDSTSCVPDGRFLIDGYQTRNRWPGEKFRRFFGQTLQFTGVEPCSRPNLELPRVLMTPTPSPPLTQWHSPCPSFWPVPPPRQYRRPQLFSPSVNKIMILLLIDRRGSLRVCMASVSSAVFSRAPPAPAQPMAVPSSLRLLTSCTDSKTAAVQHG